MNNTNADHIKPPEAGKLLGVGKTRYVYEYLPDPSYVLKIDVCNGEVNAKERKTYEMFRYFGYEHILCRINPVKKFHLMERASLNFNPGSYEISMFSPKIKNWGIVNGKIKRLDYAWGTITIEDQWYVKFLKKDLEKHLLKFNWLSKFVHYGNYRDEYCLLHYTPECFALLYKNLKNYLVV